MTLEQRLGSSWYEILKGEFKKDYMKNLASILIKERKEFNIYPESDDVFRAYRECSYVKTKVVILGQDPYHTPGMGHGLAFSVPESLGITPPSLVNILDEVERDLNEFDPNRSTDLTRWAKQGVLLLNTCLTVREGQPKSHEYIGWHNFIEKTIEYLNVSPQPIVYMLWGNDARKYAKLIDTSHHLILSSSHPSPLSCYRGFNGCGHFSKTNQFLIKNNLSAIKWI